MKPLVLVSPTFAFVIALAAVGIVLATRDALNHAAPSDLDSLIAAENEVAKTKAHVFASENRSQTIPQRIAAACVRLLRGIIEAGSSYVLMPAIFVFVVNAWPSSFSEASGSQQAMIILIPIVALLFRGFVIHKRLVDMTLDDQKLQYMSSAVSSCVAVVLSVYFVKDVEAHRSNPSFAPDIVPQYMVLFMLVAELAAASFIRNKATKPSLLEDVKWPWRQSSSSSATPSIPWKTCASFLSLPITIGPYRTTVASVAKCTAEFTILNHIALSQIVMVITGLASSGLASSSRIRSATAFIGFVPLVVSGLLLLSFAYKIALFGWEFAKRKLKERKTKAKDSNLAVPKGARGSVLESLL